MKTLIISFALFGMTLSAQAAPTDLGTDPMLTSNTSESQTAATNEVPDGSVYLNADGSANQSIDCPCNGWYGERDAKTNPGDAVEDGTSKKGKAAK